ncbi:MAG: hypothetical protein IJ419_14550 [Agathobacter sp.]|nr:hypothetical protein [Agathobacter sp.]
MIALELTDVKDFMNKLLRSEVFDHFLMQEAVITSAATYTISGQITKGFYTEEEIEEHQLHGCRFLPFAMLRGNCFDLIKGKKTPSSFRFVFLLSPTNMEKTIASVGSSYKPSDVTGMYINLKYQNQLLSLTTGIAYNIFSTDKTLENEWDKMVVKFLKQNEIAFEEI